MTQLNQEDWEVSLLAILLWREARGETVATKRWVAYTVRNRAMHPGWWGNGWVSVMTFPQQYSSLTHAGDPNTGRWPMPNDTSWMACMDIASEVYNGGFDVSLGSTHYYDKSLDDNPPEWASRMTKVADVGSFHFYKV